MSAVWRLLSVLPLLLAAVLAANAQRREFECELADGRTATRIVGGQGVRHEQYPWQVALFSSAGDFFCGGSLIGARWVLTAAHCVDGSQAPGMQTVPASAVRVVHGATDLRRAQSASHRGVAQIYPHPGYNGAPARDGNDIALLRLSEPILNSRKSYAKLQRADEARKFVFPGACAVVTGWGTTEEGGDSSPLLQAVGVPLIDQETCRQAYPGKVISSGEVCAGLPGGGRDSCQGDSGGPLVVEGLGEGQHMLAGVVSWGSGCARPEKYGVYARVSHYMPWIVRTIRGR